MHESRHQPPALTLVETLVLITVVALMITLIFPAISKARGEMRQLKCASNLRNIAANFQFFAEGIKGASRSRFTTLGRRTFHINDFQESLYRLNEYWDLGDAHTGKLKSANSPILCPAGPSQLVKRKGFPCGPKALSPIENISLAMNMRLYRRVIHIDGTAQLASADQTFLSETILNHPYTPLIMDVDGQEAVERNHDPFYMAPPGSDPHDPYATGQYWIPSNRHGGRTNVAFVGGHVLSSATPAQENWNWNYQPPLGD